LIGTLSPFGFLHRFILNLSRRLLTILFDHIY
jgi:hypothetical protein